MRGALAGAGRRGWCRNTWSGRCSSWAPSPLWGNGSWLPTGARSPSGSTAAATCACAPGPSPCTARCAGAERSPLPWAERPRRARVRAGAAPLLRGPLCGPGLRPGARGRCGESRPSPELLPRPRGRLQPTGDAESQGRAGLRLFRAAALAGSARKGAGRRQSGSAPQRVGAVC